MMGAEVRAAFITVKPSEAFPIRNGQCPECGGQLWGEVSEWYMRSNVPTPGGLLVWCENDTPNVVDERDGDFFHANTGDKWIPIQAACERWAERNVRIREGAS